MSEKIKSKEKNRVRRVKREEKVGSESEFEVREKIKQSASYKGFHSLEKMIHP